MPLCNRHIFSTAASLICCKYVIVFFKLTDEKHWLKRPKAVPQKTKLGPKYK